MTRRQLIGPSGPLAGLVLAWLALSACESAEPTCVDPDLLSTPERAARRARGYRDVSPHGETMQCAGCQFFRNEDERGCGDCEILGTPVRRTGHCSAWAKAQEL